MLFAINIIINAENNINFKERRVASTGVQRTRRAFAFVKPFNFLVGRGAAGTAQICLD